jgi:hypothetical protein
VTERRYLIWSNQHGMWWRQHRHGYTAVIEWAGLYSESEAHDIIEKSRVGEQTWVFDYLGRHPDQFVPNEVLVPVTDLP